MLDLTLWQSRLRGHLVGRLAPRTMRRCIDELAPFFAFLEEAQLTTLNDLRREDVEAYRTHLADVPRRGKRLALSTQALCLWAVKTFTAWLCEAGYTLTDVGLGVCPPRTLHGLPVGLLSETETAQLCAAVDVSRALGVRDRAILELVYGSGLRAAEVCQLTVGHLDLAGGQAHVVLSKSRRSRLVPLTDPAVHWLGRYLKEVRPHCPHADDTAALFLSRGGRPFDPQALLAVVRHAATKAGLERRVTTHGLRHSCATHMLERGAGIRQLQELLGHTSLMSTARYTHVALTELRQAQQDFHPRGQADAL